MTKQHTTFDSVAQSIINQVGKTITIGIALGIGKPIGIINALYRLAENDPSIHLTIISALTLSRPTFKTEIEKRFAEPLIERILKNYEDPLYEKARLLQQLPPNIHVIEFFLTPAKYLHNACAQENYISSAYTHVVRDAQRFEMNVVGQQLARSKDDPELYSLSCNSDVCADMLQALQQSGRKFAVVAEVNANLPFMYGDAVVRGDIFTDIVDTGKYPSLFPLPHEEITVRDHMIGIYTSTLVKDNGCLQIGIGTLSNAVANALIMRHKQNDVYTNLLTKLDVKNKFAEVILENGEDTTFTTGLYASTEMMSDEYLNLYNAGILKKRVYDHIGLQKLLNANLLTEEVTVATLDILVEQGVISSSLSQTDFNFLQHFGILAPELKFVAGKIILPNGQQLLADLNHADSKQQLIANYLGKHLKHGVVAHAGFFIGSQAFYTELLEMPKAQAIHFNMTRISRTNQLTWNPELLSLQRNNARFINSAMMITLSGAIVSDGLMDMQEISGVGGQFDFVNMGQNLKNARSIINCRSVRNSKLGMVSNIVWEYPNITIPRYLRDIVVTEYGIADCRSKTDSGVIKAILNVTDSAFQPKLLAQAKKAGKIDPHYEIPEMFRNNNFQTIAKIIHDLQAQGFCQAFPFGSELTDLEIKLQAGLMSLKNASRLKLLLTLGKALLSIPNNKKTAVYVERMGLSQPKNIREFVYKRLVQYLMRKG